MSNLLIEFTGLCGFVPKRRTQADPDYAATVLMMSRTAQHHGGLEDIHLPALVFPFDSWDPTSGRIPDQFYYEYDEINQVAYRMAICWLDDQEVTVSGLNPGFNLKDDTIGICPTNADKQLFSWVASMPKIDAAWGAVDPDCMLPAQDPSIPSTVGTRIQLTAGDLMARSFFGVSNQPYQCGFISKSGTSPHQQAIADSAGLNAPAAGTRITFSFAPLRGTAMYPDLTLNLPPDQPNQPGLLTVAIKCIPVFDLLGSRQPPVIILGTPSDQHFEQLFRFSQNGPAPGDGYLYYPIALCAGGIMVQSPRCPPASFSPVIG